MVKFPITLNSYLVGLVNIYDVLMLAEVSVKVLVRVLVILSKKKVSVEVLAILF